MPTTPGDGSSAPGHGGPPNEGPPKPLSDGDGRSESGHDGVQSVERQDPVHSHEPSGDGWHRLPDKPTDPHYGEPLPEHWDFEGDSADPSQIKASVSKLIRDPDAPFGRDDLGRAYTQDEYAERFNKLSPDGDHWMNFPGNDGAASGTKVAFTDANQFAKFYGRLLDRIGNDGKYLAIMEDGIPASWEERALHVNSLSDPYHAYTFESLPDGWQVEVSEVAPGLGQPGGSTQVRILDSTGRAMTVDELIELGVLE